MLVRRCENETLIISLVISNGNGMKKVQSSYLLLLLLTQTPEIKIVAIIGKMTLRNQVVQNNLFNVSFYSNKII